MKTPREIILERHRNAEPMLAAIRGEDLAAATRARGQLRVRGWECLARIALEFWQGAILPWRRAWAGMALVWAFLLIVNVSSGRLPIFSTKSAQPLTAENLALWREQRRLMAQWFEPAAVDVVPTKPSSDKRSEMPQNILIL